MKGISPWKERNKYTLYGAVFGALFPLVSIGLVLFISQDIRFLIGIICTAPFFLGIFARFAGVRQDNITEINRNLENLVAVRTSAIRNLMDVSGQGFLSFGPDLTVHPEYSKECEVLFNSPIPGRIVQDLLFEESKPREEFENGFTLYFQGKVKSDVIFDLMEKETRVGEKNIRIEYRTISESEVLCILTDITAEKFLESRMIQEERRKNILLNVISNKKYFASFVTEAETLFDHMEMVIAGDSRGDSLIKLQMDLHTFKGNAGFFRFEGTKDCAHELEFHIADSLILDEDIDLVQSGNVLKKSYYNELQIVRDTLGKDWIQAADAVTIPKKRYSQIESYIRKKYFGDFKLTAALEQYRKILFSDLFARFPEMVSRLAAQHGKHISPLEITGGQFMIVPDRFEPVIGSFVHLIRNMVDHGIELPEERRLRNKEPEGKISLDIKAGKKLISVTFTDDGQGISLGEVQKRALAAGIITPEQILSRSELLGLIFHRGLTTADSVSETSGRGIGMAAVKTEVNKLGGKITIGTKSGQGTTFKILLPVQEYNN